MTSPRRGEAQRVNGMTACSQSHRADTAVRPSAGILFRELAGPWSATRPSGVLGAHPPTVLLQLEKDDRVYAFLWRPEDNQTRHFLMAYNILPMISYGDE
ncbi:hypothetical protein Bbelb_037260 [Branchiostoma belcheri]|nr:hypothetical protein Bbelb_037260 [Branchiostoma belcheri]